jgi:flagellar biosynthesis protein FlhG
MGLANVDVLLGIAPSRTLEHVLDGKCTLEEAMIEVPQGFRVIPAASGVARLASMSTAEHLGLVRAFSNLTTALDVLIVDTAPGIADGVRQFCQASQPCSSYCATNLLRWPMPTPLSRYCVVTDTDPSDLANMTRGPGEGEACSGTWSGLPAAFWMSCSSTRGVPEDPFVRRAIREQRTVIDAYPSCAAARAFKKLARTADNWSMAASPRGNLEFFVERMVGRPRPHLRGLR